MRLTVQALDKSYSTQVLRNVNLQVGPGEIHAIVGENGAGKTTLLNHILEDPNHGLRFAIIENEFGEVGVAPPSRRGDAQSGAS